MQEAMRQISASAMSIIALFAFSMPCLAEQFNGRVLAVSDGDTITVLCEETPRKIRLSGIDCPEKGQSFGQQAKLFTSTLVLNQEVKVVSIGRDRYGRMIGEVYLADGRNLNNLLLENGYAWWYQKYSSDEHRHELQEIARKSSLGLWQDLRAEAPWDFRHMHHN